MTSLAARSEQREKGLAEADAEATRNEAPFCKLLRNQLCSYLKEKDAFSSKAKSERNSQSGVHDQNNLVDL